ncbi:MAG: valine--tRNA ligase [Bacillota bacterium]
MDTEIPKTLPTTYDPQQVEDKWYRYWADQGCFKPTSGKLKESFTIVIPPPNVTGTLHLGHALNNTLQDILIRWRRMQGYETLWVPGTDHAGIATQARVEENLAKEGLNKYELGREKFLERVWDWKDRYGSLITTQLRKLGASCDWSRERFTMDEGCSQAVREVFIRLYHKGLIYRGNYIINWCPKCQTTISDIEVEHLEREGKLYHLRYPLKDGSGVVVDPTTRPETMLGDTAVAVHPGDERYQHLIGKMLILPVVGREIPIVADEHVDPDFGSGAVKVTPAHDPNDFEIALRHKLPHVVVIGKDATMTPEAGPYQGFDRYQCREELIDELQALGVLLKIEDHSHAVGQCYRCDTVIEPLVSRQWFVKMKPLAEPAMQAAREGNVNFVPERFTKIYLGWLENIRDWCISRQLWWGHRIPVWYCQECDAVICAVHEPDRCSQCNGDQLEQDPDVLDTWFSSALWPFSTLGWPDKTPELDKFYPTSVLVTGRDIIFFWVARMIIMALEFMGEAPFEEVFIHGLVLDAQGRKMSKSLGNGVDPIEVIEQYGADSLRFMLVTGNTPGNDLRFNFERLEGSRNFANKIWNAARFALINLADFRETAGDPSLTLADKWILSRYNQTVGDVTRCLDSFELGEAARTIYEFIWGELCDWYIELIKPRLYGHDDPVSRATAQHVLRYVLSGAMRLLHPFMPFITEEIWHHIPGSPSNLILSDWPETLEELKFPEAEARMALTMEIIRNIRNIRGEMNVSPGQAIEVIVVAPDDEAQVLDAARTYLSNLVQARTVRIERTLADKPARAATAVVGNITIYVPLEGLIDFDKEIRRLDKELASVEKDLDAVERKLANPEFLGKAPQAVVDKERAKQAEFTAKQVALRERLEFLRS